MLESEVSELQVTYLKSGARRYLLEIRHTGLHKYQVVRGDDPHIVTQKAYHIMAGWNRQWSAREEKNRKAQTISEGKDSAAERTLAAEAALEELETILAYTLAVNDEVDWESLKNKSDYPEPAPVKPRMPRIPAGPERSDSKYTFELSLMDRMVKGRREAKELQAQSAFDEDQQMWLNEKSRIEATHADALKQWEKDSETWILAKEAFLKQQDASNATIEQQRDDYLTGNDPQAILDYCDIVLSSSRYPDYFPQSFELDYNPDTKFLVVDYQLPSLNDIPTLQSVRFIQSRQEYSEKHISQAALRRLYDNLLYQIALRTLHELFEADRINAIDIIVFNGYVDSIDPATGQESNSCILSISVGKEEFEQINLTSIEPSACFKRLKGVSASRLYSLTPVAPLMKIDREDSRFVSSYDVADAIEGENLAAMDWADFEHLIRELFESEFASAGGEVKVTRASRDGGIDAVAFDPDPIRGGKIVIQAKRYTNTVGVSAVRDLYGTIINEGAGKGILVTTADFGPDAHQFAVGKPIVLLNGAQLLYLLEKHGHTARIDLKEAKQIAIDRG